MGLSNRCIIANQKFIYKKEGDHLKGKLKYFQHRDDKDTHIQQRDEKGNPIRRWEDRGLGDTYNKIARNCLNFATSGLKNDVGARTLVLSPQVEFMAAIPPDMRLAVMAELTDATVERWFEAMRIPPAEYVFVVHQGEVKTDRPDGVKQQNKEFVHSHVVLAATTPGLIQDRENYKIYKEQLEQLHQVSTEEMERIWTRELGLQRVQALNQDLEELTETLRQIDLEKSQIVQPNQDHSQQAIDEAMLELYEVTMLEPSVDLLARVYDARLAQATDFDPIAELLDLGFEIEHEEPTPIRDMEAMGFDFSGMTEINVQKDVVAIARDLGFEIPQETSHELTDKELDILDVYRDLGFMIPDDEFMPSDELEDILEDMRALGFEIPTVDDVDIEPELQPEMPDLDMD
jgi:hypothetical protein